MGNGKITMAKIEQKLEDHIVQNDKDVKEIKLDTKDIKIAINEMKQILVKGDGKIKRNYDIGLEAHKKHDEHAKDHRWWFTTIVSLCGLLTLIISLLVAHFG